MHTTKKINVWDMDFHLKSRNPFSGARRFIFYCACLSKSMSGKNLGMWKPQAVGRGSGKLKTELVAGAIP